MRESMRKLISRLPLSFRVLYGQFLLRVIDLEALSIEADIPRFLGQFAGVLIMISLLQVLSAFWNAGQIQVMPLAFVWSKEQSLISDMMLVAGLFTVVSWDNTFPDRRDVMVLSPLPVRPLTILLAKVSALGAIIGLSILALNIGSGFAWPLVLVGFPGVLRFCPAYWLTMVAASLFLYCAVLTIQGFTALLLPRRIFLSLSAVLQLVAYGLFLGAFFLLPTFTSLAEWADARNRRILALSPPYWFWAFFNQLNGSLPPRDCLVGASGMDCSGARCIRSSRISDSLLFADHEENRRRTGPVPRAGGLHWTPRFGGPLQTAIVLFSFRSISRSRQHRVVLAFYLSIVFAIALVTARDELSTPALRPLSPNFLFPRS